MSSDIFLKFIAVGLSAAKIVKNLSFAGLDPNLLAAVSSVEALGPAGRLPGCGDVRPGLHKGWPTNSSLIKYRCIPQI